MNKPEILAPAGSRESFMAALAAGADAVYLGMKNFSARMQADNFSLPDLAGLVELAHSENRRVYIALNTILKPDELSFAGSQIKFLAQHVRPDALIVQDAGVIELARQAGFEGEIHLSTLANVTHQQGLLAAKKLGASRVILPRELSIDEVKSMNEACPPGLELEMFVHGALCYCVSGRCYWSSYMGGKSGLRGQCVQPCRRIYKQRNKESAFFSCLDLSLDVLAKTLLPIENVKSWKLEGRRKGPHYVYYVTTAYKMMRDNPGDPATKKDVEELLQMALGRAGTKAGFLPQNKREPTVPHSSGEETASGMFMGRLSMQGGNAPQGKGGKARATFKERREQVNNLALKPWHPVLAGDYFRVGNEDNPWHYTFPVRRGVPKGGMLTISPPKGKFPPVGAPVFLLDRREPELIAAIAEWEEKAGAFPPKGKGLSQFSPVLPPPAKEVAASHTQPTQKGSRDKGESVHTVVLSSSVPHGKDTRLAMRPGMMQGLWLTRKVLDEVSRTMAGRISWWLPPVIWPDEEASWRQLLAQAVNRGAKRFVCNSPWQLALFASPEHSAELAAKQDLRFMAGPFCNTGNALALGELARLGFDSAIVSPELSGEDMLALARQTPLPLGVVLSGFWPVGISRHSFAGGRLNEPFQSPKREIFWARHYGENLWLYPGWPLDIQPQKELLLKAGYKIFIRIDEQPPKELPEPSRTSPFNWDLGLL
ncbi:MAG: U32 family peptidase [Desulfovibrionaceae bacterium]|nr:U32 family peptidase [Desulfovibrionaceae bacterium]